MEIPCALWEKRGVGSKGSLLSGEIVSFLSSEPGKTQKPGRHVECRITVAQSGCLHEKWVSARSKKRNQGLQKLEVWLWES